MRLPILDLSAHFSRYRANERRIHLAAHSHHYWPDITRDAQLTAWDDACRHADEKWGVIFGEVIPAVQRGIARILNLPDPETIAFAPNTHDFVTRLLSALPTGKVPRILTSDGEFHSFARQVARLEEDGLVAVERVAHEPLASFPDRLCEAARAGSHDLIFVSQILFNAGGSCGDLANLANAVPDPSTLVCIDGYHGFMALPTDLSAISERVFYLSGGYKYAMAGENVCFIHCPPGHAPRPRDTGWYAAFGALTERQVGVPYGAKGGRFWGATFDPVGLYRQRAVFAWMDAIGLTIPALHHHALALQERFLEGIRANALADFRAARLITPMSTTRRGHFLTFETAQAGSMHERLLAAGIITDVRADRIRFGFGCYQTAEDIELAVDAVSRALRHPSRFASPA